MEKHCIVNCVLYIEIEGTGKRGGNGENVRTKAKGFLERRRSMGICLLGF